jgi:hypothetical protein
MLRSMNGLKGYHIAAEDGLIGTVHDFFFDDEFWVVRYLAVDTGHWLPGRKVLITPGVLGRPDWAMRRFPVALTREQVEKSPDIDTDKPVSRQEEIRLERHYAWRAYQMPVSEMSLPLFVTPPLETENQSGAVGSEHDDPHLRSFKEVTGYHIQATDGGIGHLDDLLADDQVWDIRYLVADTRNWLPGRKVLVSLQWLVGQFSWDERKVKVRMTKESIKHSPKYDPSVPISREYESRLHDHYGQPGYWEEPGSKS